ncbi:hypothetical protein BDF22DRAFT_744259 [Syncephalis plumigaleata]|nr:hypothetical protein BDF22DRAFT_744259 [Syncephalis plumigaleata]
MLQLKAFRQNKWFVYHTGIYHYYHPSLSGQHHTRHPYNILYPIRRVWLIISDGGGVDASITLMINNRTVSYPTYDPYGDNLSPYKFTGVLVTPIFSKGKACTLELNETQTDIASVNDTTSHAFTNTIIVIKDKDANAGKCATLANTCRSAVRFGKEMEKLGWPPMGAVLYVYNKHGKGDGGEPYSIEYTTRSSDIPDGTPDAPMAIVPFTYHEQVQALLQNNTNEYLTATIEEGIFMGDVAWHSIISLWSLSTIFLWSSGIVLFTITIPMDCTTHVFKKIRAVSALLFNTSFYMLLLIWYSIYSAFAVKRLALIFKFVIYILLALQMVLQAMKTITYYMSFDFTSKFWPIANYFGMILRVTASVLFFYYGVSFRRRKNRYSENSPTYSALAQLSRTAFACSISFIVNAATNITPLLGEKKYTVAGIFLMHVIGYLNSVVGLFILQSELSLRLPSDIASKRTYSHFTDLFALYKLWRHGNSRSSMDTQDTPVNRMDNIPQTHSLLKSANATHVTNASATLVQPEHENIFSLPSSVLQSGYGYIVNSALQTNMETIIDHD